MTSKTEVTIPQAYQTALQFHQAGRLGEAEGLYRQILAVQPGHGEAWHQLGVIALQMGRYELAIQWIGRAVVLRPGDAGAHCNLGSALRSVGRLDEAMCHFQGALRIAPHLAEAENNLGLVLKEQGKWDEAMAAFRRALELEPDDPVALLNVGNLLTVKGQREEALATIRRAVELHPDFPEAHYNLGNVLRKGGQWDEAAAAYRRALELRPQYSDAWGNLGIALAERNEPDEAITAYRRALELNPKDAAAQSNLSGALKDRGEVEEAVKALRRAVELAPGQPWVLSNLIYTLLFQSRLEAEVIAADEREWNRRFAEPLRKEWKPHTNDPEPERRLRIGYVSPDFYRHPICHFMRPLLEGHDRERVEVYCYASVRRPDEFTERARRAADVWRDVLSLDDAGLAERIREDEIDILVDLTQHMANNRLLLFGRKPAPVQVSWLGYPAGTGLPAIDYRLTDHLLDPEGAYWADSVEKPIRLPHCWFCFDQIESPEVTALPALRAGHVTFGCLNNFCKVNEAVLRMWAAILRTVEGSRLLLHCPAGVTRERLREWFSAQGIAADRLELVGRTATREDYFRLYQRIDIGLDPFPYNGGTTTCDALWMGVPVVSLAGRSGVSRIGLSVSTNLGLPEWVASSEAEYVAITTRQAADLSRLADLRGTLRARLEASPLMDTAGFAREVEHAYRTMWRQWSEKSS
jgi:predicted O-linked N-acetylglucosamine transferase (SPINDLY family)